MSDAGQTSSFGGRFTVLGLIGQGGMARVLRVMDTNLGIERALKHPVAHTELPLAEVQARFHNEWRTAACVSHPGLLSIIIQGGEGVGIDSLPYYVMELVVGKDMGAIIEEFGALPARAAVELIIGVLEPVEALHKARFLHRDLKPPNILVRNDGKVKVVDLGIAKSMSVEIDPGMKKASTQVHQVLGTPEYMSPEQMEINGEMDERWDLFAIAIILWQLLTGETNVPKRMQTTDAPGHPRLAKVPEPLRPIICGALRDRHPMRSYRYAGDMIRALKAAMKNLPEDESDRFYAWLAGDASKLRSTGSEPPALVVEESATAASRVVVLSPPRDEWPESRVYEPPSAWRRAAPLLAVAAALLVILFAGTVLFRGSPPEPAPVASAPSRSEHVLTDTVASMGGSPQPSFANTVAGFNTALAAGGAPAPDQGGAAAAPVAAPAPASPPAAAPRPTPRPAASAGSRDTGTPKRAASATRPAPATTAPVDTTPSASAAPTKGTVQLLGVKPAAAQLVSQTGGGTFALPLDRPLDVPPGTYRVDAKFKGESFFKNFHTVEVKPGKTTRVRCDGDIGTCTK